MQSLFGMLARRLSEPSSWAAISTALGTAGYSIPSPLWQSVSLVGMGLTGALAFFLPEATAK